MHGTGGGATGKYVSPFGLRVGGILANPTTVRSSGESHYEKGIRVEDLTLSEP